MPAQIGGGSTGSLRVGLLTIGAPGHENLLTEESVQKFSPEMGQNEKGGSGGM